MVSPCLVDLSKLWYRKSLWNRPTRNGIGFYIPDPKERESNIDWVPPHDHHHSVAVDRMKDLSKRAYRGEKRRSPRVTSVAKRSMRRKGGGAEHSKTRVSNCLE